MRVFNCTSGSINPITWGTANEQVIKYVRKCPSKYQLMYPSIWFVSGIRFLIMENVYHLFVPLIADGLMWMRGVESNMFQIAKTVKTKTIACEYFYSNEWMFGVNNALDLMATVQKDAKNANEFNCDIKIIDWNKYIENFCLGTRRYLLQESDSTIPVALTKQN